MKFTAHALFIVWTIDSTLSTIYWTPLSYNEYKHIDMFFVFAPMHGYAVMASVYDWNYCLPSHWIKVETLFTLKLLI